MAEYRKAQPLKLTPYLLSFFVCLALASSGFGKETVYLKNGFSLEAESCQQQGEITVLNTGNGTLEFATDQISRIETSPEPATGHQPLPAAAALSVATESLLVNAALAQGVDAAFVRSVAKVESGLRQDAVSNKGARGLMQLMPETAQHLNVNAAQADDNALGGAKYLRELLLQYHGDSVLALAAYNAGPGAVAKYGGVPPYTETQRYIVKVLKEYQRQLTRQKLSSAQLKEANKPTATN